MKNNLVTVATFTDPITANLAKQRLQAEGIQAYLADEATVDSAWHLTVAVGWIKLQVPQSDVAQAQYILGESELNTSEIDEDDDIKPLSWADQTVDRAYRAAIIALLFFPLLLYSVLLLMRLLLAGQPVSQNKKIKLILTVIIDVLYIFMIWKIFF